jgi:hypothetical protein
VSVFTVSGFAERGLLPVVRFHADQQDALPRQGRGQAHGAVAVRLYAETDGRLRFAGKDP